MPKRAATVPGAEPNLNVGTNLTRSCTCEMLASRSAAPPNAWIEIGSFWTFSDRFCAVTTLSSIPAGGGAVFTGVCAGVFSLLLAWAFAWLRTGVAGDCVAFWG